MSDSSKLLFEQITLTCVFVRECLRYCQLPGSYESLLRDVTAAEVATSFTGASVQALTGYSQG